MLTKTKIYTISAILIILVFFITNIIVLTEQDAKSPVIHIIECISFLFFIPLLWVLSKNHTSSTQKSIDEFDKFVDHSTIISKADANGKITYVNDKFESISGWTLKEVIGKDHNLVNSGHHPKDFWTDMYKTVVKDKKIWNAVCTNKSKNGDLYYVDTFIKAEFDDEDKLLGFMSIRQDVTELKTKETEIRNRMNAINRSNAVIEFDLYGNIIFVNELFKNIMGYTKDDELIGKHHSMLVSSEFAKTEEYKKFWEDLREGKLYSGDVIRIRKDNKDVHLQATYNPILNTYGKTYRIMKIATDITTSYNQSKELEKKNTYLEHAAKIIRHDMHSGINTYIPRGVSSLERRLTPEDVKNLKIEAPLKMIKEGLKHTQKVYRGVYEFTNLVKPNAILTKNGCDLKVILKNFLSSTSYSNQVIIENLPVMEVNEPLFCTALDNLIRNGLKYNDSETKFVKIYFKKENKYGLYGKYICVEDNGRGMTQTDFEYLSKPYTRKKDQKESGTGLGLNICVTILQEHGFSVSCEKVDTGTKIKIKLN